MPKKEGEGRAKKKRWSVPLSHPSYSIEECPNCGFPEFDGGYCPECGLTQHGRGCRCKDR